MPEKQISLDQGVARVDQILPALGKVAELQLHVEGPVAREVIFLHVENRPTSEVMTKLAVVTCAQWRTESDGSMTLFRSESQAKEEMRKEHLRKVNTLNRYLTRLRQELQSWDDDSSHTMARYVAGLDTNLIADLPPQASVVFATNPNPAQRPFSRLSYEQTPIRAIFIASCYSENAYRLDFKLYSEDETVVQEIHRDDLATWVEDEPEGPKPTNPYPDPKPSPATQAFLARANRETKAASDADIKLLRPFLDDPERNDPLWLGNQDLLSATAKLKGKSVVACLPDEALPLYTEGLDLTGFITQPARNGMALTETDRWMEFRPRSFAYHWTHRASRSAMAALARDVNEKGTIGIVTYARLSASCGPNGDINRMLSFAQFCNPRYRLGWMGFREPFQSGFTALLAKLDESQLKRLERGETIPYRTLTSEQRAMAQRIVYGVRVNVDIEGSSPEGTPDEPTLELPGGILQGAGLSASMGEDLVAMFHNGLDPAHDIFYQDNLSEPPYLGWMGPGPVLPVGGMEYTTYDLRRRKQITLKCALAPGHYVIGKFEEPDPPATKKPVFLKNLPANVQKRLEPTVDFFQRFFDEYQRQDGGGSSDPPPR